MMSKERMEFKKAYNIIIRRLLDRRPITNELNIYNFNNNARKYATKEEYNLYHSLKKKEYISKQGNNIRLMELKQKFEEFIENSYNLEIDIPNEATIYYNNFCTYDEKLIFEHIIELRKNPILCHLLSLSKDKDTDYLLDKARIIINSIQKGIHENNNTTRSFELLDYYNITNIKLSKMAEIVANLGTNETEIFKNFTDKYKHDYKIDVKEELENKLIIQGHIVSDEEKIEIFDYLKRNNLPLTNAIYRQAIKRKINGIPYQKENSVYNNKQKRKLI